uniref:SAM-dependent MTase RsmB/NOP-type domain-containing protein n=1 Tax=Globisporangium ultimum (strain ATCC 200006 / CBS 805.95 / DAOM BR144) TaxID=431595 RepID=K3WB17_GLOUD
MATTPTTTTASDAPKKQKTSLELYKQSFREYLMLMTLRDAQKETSAVRNDEELDQLMALLHEPLPVSFRLNLHRPDAMRVQKLLTTEHQFFEDKYFYNETPITPPKSIVWYPIENIAWQVDCGRTALSKSAPKHAEVKAFHACLLEHTEMGTIDRQEAVSMLPVLFLDVQPAHRVLDMCASPGSKTTQVIDFLLTSSTTEGETKETSKGMVIANDLDKKRAYMLVHRLSRNTLRNAVVTCGAGDLFPGLYDKASGALQPTNVFDRVLCDVPCSGDGTLRKNQALWKEWHIGQGLTLHPVQLLLALRGAALLCIGGMMVYSTCSFNPVENEAIVAELLRRSSGALELVDVSQKLPQLKYRKGRTTWNVGWRSKSKSTHKGHIFRAAGGDEEHNDSSNKGQLHEWFSSYDAIPQDLRGQRLLRSMFAPAATEPISAELEKTLRLIPTDQNSGGFFIAVLRKTANLPGDKQEGLAPLEENFDLVPPADYVCKLCNGQGHFMKNCEKYVPVTEYVSEHAPKTKKQRTEGRSEEKKAYVKPRETMYRPVSNEVWEQIQQFYGIQDESLKARFWCRSDGAANVNYVDEEIADACLGGDAIEIVNTGLKVFSKLSERGETYYRPSEEALGFIDHFFSKRILKLSAEDFSLLLQTSSHLPFTSLSESAQEYLSQAGIGPGVAQVALNNNISFCIWIGNGSILPRVSKTMRVEVEQALKFSQL